jgi:hypothetical protein
MNRKPDGARGEGEILSPTAPLEVRPAVDETQSNGQGATAPQPKLEIDDDADDVSGADLDEAWAELTSSLLTADRDFDAAAAYSRLSRSLPPELVAMPLVELPSVGKASDWRFENRNLVLGLIAMGTVCAGLACLAVFGPGFERRSASERDLAALLPAVPQPDASSIGAGEVWADVRWEERLLALDDELHAERRRIVDGDHGSFDRPDEELRRLERDFAQVRDSFGRPFGF